MTHIGVNNKMLVVQGREGEREEKKKGREVGREKEGGRMVGRDEGEREEEGRK